MSSRNRSRKRNKPKRRTVKKYDSYSNNRRGVYVGPQRYIKLHLSQNFENILIRILDKSKDPIADKLLKDSKKDKIQTTISWINITKSNNHLSYAIPGKVNGDAWGKINRNVIQIRKLIKILYKGFSNTQIRSFISKFKSVYQSYTQGGDKQQNINMDDDGIIDSLIDYTKNKKIKWDNKSSYDYITQLYTNIYLTDNKHLSVTIYDIKTKSISYIVIYFVNNNKKTHVKTVNGDDINKLKMVIKDNA